ARQCTTDGFTESVAPSVAAENKKLAREKKKEDKIIYFRVSLYYVTFPTTRMTQAKARQTPSAAASQPGPSAHQTWHTAQLSRHALSL
ncbi:hypothetical protein BaRGS_00040259, partial [Batillaria attramentaria]